MRRISVSVAMVLLAQAAWAQLGLPHLGKKDPAKEREKQVEKAEKSARAYEKLKEFSQDLHDKDLDFRERVEKHYDTVQQDHSAYAFEKNVAAPARTTVVHDGDRLRLQTGLYDNKIVQDYVNRIGQQLVPEDSDKLFAFRLVAHPVPFAETLSTGTIYISTGLISLLDNEAQLAYVLGHEMAHVYKDHWRLKSMMLLGEEEYNNKQEVKRTILGIGASLVGAGIGGAIGQNAKGALIGGASGLAAGLVAGQLFMRGMNLDWDKVQEDEADSIAFKAVLNRNYDVQEVPKLYAALQTATQKDHRVGMGFMGSRKRVQERIANASDMLSGTFKAEIEQKLKEGRLSGSGPDFSMVMSELKRDNGILAFYHDMFQLSKNNLEYAVAQRSNDPAAHYYYGKVLKLVGRSPADRQAADQEFVRAISLDSRERYYGAHLYRALALMSLKDPAQNPEIVKSLQAYLTAHMTYSSVDADMLNHLPANLDDMYDYLAQAGEVKWSPRLPEGVVGVSARGPAPAVPTYTDPASLPSSSHPAQFGGGQKPQGPAQGQQIRNVVEGAKKGAIQGGLSGGSVGGRVLTEGAKGAATQAVSPAPRQ